MKLSIIIPIYNSENEIERCISSILNQINNNIEVVLVNDGSTDRSLDICETFQKKYSTNIIVIDKKNEGQGIARNFGIERATGDYITFIDSDDYLEANSLTNILEIMQNKKSDLYITNWCYKFADKEVINKRKEHCAQYVKGDNYNYFINNMIWPEKNNSFGSAVWAKFYNLKTIKDNRIRFCSEREFFSEDLIFNLDYLNCINNVMVLDNVTYYYVQSNVSFKNKYQLNYFNKLKRMCDYFECNKEKYYGLNVESSINKRIFSYLKTCIINEVRFSGLVQGNNNIKNFCKDSYIGSIIDQIVRISKGIDRILAFFIKNKMSFEIMLLYKLYLSLKK